MRYEGKSFACIQDSRRANINNCIACINVTYHNNIDLNMFFQISLLPSSKKSGQIVASNFSIAQIDWLKKKHRSHIGSVVLHICKPHTIS